MTRLSLANQLTLSQAALKADSSMSSRPKSCPPAARFDTSDSATAALRERLSGIQRVESRLRITVCLPQAYKFSSSSNDLPTPRSSTASSCSMSPGPKDSAWSTPAKPASRSAFDEPVDQPKPELSDEDIMYNAIKLHCMTGWQHINSSDGLRTEEVSVDYCDKKAVRFTTVINCSLSCLIDTLQDEQFAKEFDPQLNTLETIPASAETGHRVAYYTNFKQVTPFVSARDFISTAATGRVPTDVVLKYGLGGSTEDSPKGVWFQNNVSCGGKPVQPGYVRGRLHTFAYFAWCRPENEEGPDARLVFANVSVLDTAGWIPAWVLSAARAERAKIVNNIKALCERRFNNEEKFRV